MITSLPTSNPIEIFTLGPSGGDCLDIISACNVHSGEVLAWGLGIGMIVGMAGMYFGMWYYSRKK